MTTAWDRAHDVIASMGDRFVVLRMDSTVGGSPAGGVPSATPVMKEDAHRARDRRRRRASGRAAGQAITLTGGEQSDLAAANVVTLARTGVDYDYRGDVIDAHAPEMPTRFAKQLAQVVRGAVALGVDRTAALTLAIRCARDSMPPLRLAIITDLVTHPASKVGTVAARLGKPYNTVNRQMQALWLLRVVDAHNSHGAVGLEYGNANNTTYSLNPDRGPDSLDFPEISSSERYGMRRRSS